MQSIDKIINLSPLDITNCTIIMPDRLNGYNSGFVRNYITELLKKSGKNAAFLPKMATLYDIAREISGFESGNQIRETDFSVLLIKDQSKKIPLRFIKIENQAYRKHLLKLLDLLSLNEDNFNLLHSSFSDLVKIGMNSSVVSYIFEMVRSRGYHFLGDIYSTAIDKLKTQPDLLSDTFFLIPGGFYSVIEKQMLNLLGFSKEEIKESLVCENGQTFIDIFITGESLKYDLDKFEYLKAITPIDQADQIIYDISAKLSKNSSFVLSDFTVICQTGESLNSISATFTAQNISFAAPVQNPTENSLYLVLTALKLGNNSNIVELTTFYNLYCDHKNIIELDLKSTGEEMTIVDFEKIFDKQSKDNFQVDFVKDEDQRRIDLEKFKSFLLNVKLVDKNKIQSLKTAFKIINDKIIAITKLLKNEDKEIDLYGYQPAIEKLFGTNITLTELLNYLIEIAGTNSKPHEQNYNGVNIVTVKDCLQTGKICYLVDLEENKFLRWNEYNRLLDRDKYDELEIAIYGRTKESFIVSAFKSLWQDQVEKIIFIIPAYSDSTIITTKFDNILNCYPKKLIRVTDGIKQFGEFVFNYEFQDLLKEKVNQVVKTEEISLPINSDNLSFEYPIEDLKQNLCKATDIEKFMLCPANFVAALKSEYNEIKSTESFLAGRYFHDIVQDFLEFFRGKDLLCGETYQRVLAALIKESNKSGFADSKIDLLVASYLYDINPDKPEHVFQELIYIFDSFGLRNKLFERLSNESDKTKIYGMQKDNQKIVGFITKLLCEIGPTPVAVTESFLTELMFGNFTILPGITIKSGYMDLVLIDYEGKIRLFDLKSGNISEYATEMDTFQIVQLQIYREVLTKAIREHEFTCFDSVVEPKDERKFSNLSQIYRIHQQPEVHAAYLSYKTTFKVELKADFGSFLEKMSLLLKENRFYPAANHTCSYCNLQGGCDKFTDSCIKLDDYLGKGFAHCDQAYTNFPRIENMQEKTTVQSADNEKKIVQFAKNSNQEKAVESIRDSIVISAGAGAGKTEVLSAKYINLLINDSVEVQNIVCITFTNKAVGEMQKRIYNRLNDCINTGCFFSLAKDSDEEYKLNGDQIAKLKRSKEIFFKRNQISTFHAFCKQLLDRYGSQVFEEFDLENSLAPEYVLKDNLKRIVKAKHCTAYRDYLNNLAYDELAVFHNWLAGQNFYYETGFGSGGGLMNELLNLITKINLSPKGFESINPDISEFNHRKDSVISEIKKNYDFDKDILVKQAEKVKIELPVNDNRFDKINKIISQIQNDDFSFKGTDCSKSEKKDSPELFRAIDKLFVLKKEISSHLYFQTLTENEDDEAIIHKALYYICAGLYCDMEKFKQEKGIIEQNDFHLRLIDLLEKDKNILANLQNEFTYYLLDEFQDTNWLQDGIINLLYKPQENFLFIVGDLKQSIYRFQQCDNNIFMKYIHAGHKFLPFQHNYRSEPEIINFNNRFFSENTNPNYNIFINTAKNPDYPEFALSGKKSENKPLICFTEIYSNQKKCCLDNAENCEITLTQAEINRLIKIKEAEFICRTIQKNIVINNNQSNFSDFGILIRSYTKIDYLLEMLKKYNIPYGFTMKKGLFSLLECQEFIKILKAVYGIINFSEIEYIPQINQISKEISIKASLLLYPLAMQIFKHPVFCAYAERDIEYTSRMDNLRALMEVIAEADSLFNNPAEKFFHLDKLAEADSNGMETSDNNAVKIMTVHSSKGLEFNNLFLVNVGERDNSDKSYISFVNKSFSKQNKENFIDFSVKGFKGIAKDDEKKFWFAAYLKNENQKLDEAEAANLLYVALTRAKKNIFVTLQKSSDKESDGSEINWLKNIEGNLFRDSGKSDLGLDFMGHNFTVRREKICIGELHEFKTSSLAIIHVPHRPEFPEFKTSDRTTATNSDNKESSIAQELGNLVHKFLENNLQQCFTADFDLNLYLSKINTNQEMNRQASDMINQVRNCNRFYEMIKGSSKLIKEQSLILLDNDKQIYGTADLLIFKENRIIIVDYKTFSGVIKNELIVKYKNQIDVYKNALTKIFIDTEICCFLMFISSKECKLIEI